MLRIPGDRIRDLAPGQTNEIKEFVRVASEKCGTQRALASALGVNASSIFNWRRVPDYRVLDFERLSGIPKEELRPDLFKNGKAKP